MKNGVRPCATYGKQYAMDANFNVVTTTAVAQDYGFTGRRFDRESGLYYFRARYYDADLGRFISRDPWQERVNEPSPMDGYQDGLNLYQGYFVPIGIDPNGEAVVTVAITTWFLGNAAVNFIEAAVYGYYCTSCTDDAKDLISDTAEGFGDNEVAYRTWLNSAKPGDECKSLCVPAGVHLLKAVVWIACKNIKYMLSWSRL